MDPQPLFREFIKASLRRVKSSKVKRKARGSKQKA
jgi:hypothetical protein